MSEFANIYYENERFSKLILEKGRVEHVEFHDCEFNKSSFCESSFIKCIFNNCRFTSCDLSNIGINNSSFIHTKFMGSKMIGIDWVSSGLGKKEIIKINNPISFYDCVLNYSVFLGLDLKNVQIEKCLAKEVDFSEAVLKGANFLNSDLAGSIFNQTDLTQANFVGAKNYSIVPGVNKLKGTKFSMPEAMSLLYSMEIEIVDELAGNESDAD
ncbi:MAG: pentapeptide repeat-containing protein [Chloroflexi bacterium]|nr:pentapeptide repeat-containing protein [Chloroflexota bacterium]MBT3668988.1 pentapeptide repeat-containing protein [Chloroflexota bacterium]MBT4002191.1 pentapeptide repeat-containing protein [Chloroflexota bacterium]MBT4304959.1 pentapeptide repeat-containing protein [Chloroflexota bacterium]MBT4533278.1 pentapeptide repeat-containing protein [Chloroflexota bacterium]